MYLDNKYTKIYYRLISNAKNRITNTSCYYERHHIIPKSLGGSDNLSNLVFLTGREHLICHLLLIRMTEGKAKAKMISAAWSMANLENKHQDRKRLTSRQYSNLRKIFSEQHSIRMRNDNPMHKLEHKKTHKEAIIKRGKTRGMSGKRHSMQTIEKIKQANKNQYISPEQRKAASIFHSNRSPELKEKYGRIHASNITCKHCGKLSNPGTHARWHGQRCKLASKIS